MARTIEVKNWQKFQHYSERRPPWIKVYTHLLDDLEYLRLSDAAQAGLIRVWLLSARLGHPLPHDLDLICGKAVIKKKELLELIARGWLAVVDASAAASTEATGEAFKSASESASIGASNCASEMLGPQTRARAVATEDRGQREKLLVVGGALADPVHRSAYEAYRASHRMPDGFDATLRSVHAPSSGGEGFPWEIIGAALVEMRGASATFSPAALRGFCRRLVRGEPAVAAASRSSNGRQDRNVKAIEKWLESASGH